MKLVHDRQLFPSIMHLRSHCILNFDVKALELKNCPWRNAEWAENMTSSCHHPHSPSLAKFSCCTPNRNCSAESQGSTLNISGDVLSCSIKASSLLNTPLIRAGRKICNHVKLDSFGVSLHT